MKNRTARPKKTDSSVKRNPVGERRVAKQRRKPQERREDLREQLWPNSASLVWDRLENDGFSTIPRLLPLILVLLSHLSRNRGSKGDPSPVYLELWARSYDGGFVQIRDEQECAYAAGYSGTRATRSWRERIYLLKELGFIKSSAMGNREYAYILIVNPLLVCTRIRHEQPGLVPDEWWNAFVARADEVRADLPTYDNSVAALDGQYSTAPLTEDDIPF